MKLRSCLFLYICCSVAMAETSDKTTTDSCCETAPAVGGAADTVTTATESVQFEYHEQFEASEIGAAPADMLILEGGFLVAEHEGGKALQLPGNPINLNSVLWGPNEYENFEVGARIHALRRGRRFPEFGLGVCGVRGYALRVAPARDALELMENKVQVASVPYEWKSGVWLQLRLRVTKTSDAEWRVAGKVWPAGSAEPDGWTIKRTLEKEPPAGRSLVFAVPYSNEPVLFDDLSLRYIQE